MAEETVAETAQANHVFVGGLPTDTTGDEMSAHFASLNITPTSVSMFEDAKGRSKGCALAIFEDEAAAAAGIEAIDGSTMKEKEIFARADRGPRRRQRRVIENVNEDQSYVFIGNLSLDVQEDNLRNLLSQYGTLVDLSITCKRRSETSVGYANAHFSSDEEAQAAIAALSGSEFEGKTLTVEHLKRPPRSRESRAKAKKERRERNVEQEEEPVPTNEAILYVGNLVWTTDEDELTKIFSEYGEVVKSEIARDRRADRSRGWGRVEFANVDQAKAAIEGLNGTELEGREIEVAVSKGPRRSRGRKAKPAENDQEESGGRRRRRRGRRDEEGEEQGGEEREGGRRRRRRRGQGEDGEPVERVRKERKKPEPTVVSNPECFLFVGNLDWEVNDDSLRELFEAQGTVASAKVTMDRKGGRSRGWGTVEMGSGAEAAAAAAAMHDTEFGGRPLVVRADDRVVAE